MVYTGDYCVFVLGLVLNSRWGQLDMMGKIDAIGTTGFCFDHDVISLN